MKLIGQILLWAGFLVGALATVTNSSSKGVEFVKGLTPNDAEEARYEYVDLSAVEVPKEEWSLIPWSIYIPSAVTCMIGIGLLTAARSTAGQKSEKTEASLAEIKVSLARVIENIHRLSGETESLAPSKIAKRIEIDLSDDLRDFAEGRDSITAEYGLAVFADVMTQFAAGERSINRAWSAAADGYVDEAATCIERAETMMQAAQAKLQAGGA
jgi:hypothetical protein